MSKQQIRDLNANEIETVVGGAATFTASFAATMTATMSPNVSALGYRPTTIQREPFNFSAIPAPSMRLI